MRGEEKYKSIFILLKATIKIYFAAFVSVNEVTHKEITSEQKTRYEIKILVIKVANSTFGGIKSRWATKL